MSSADASVASMDGRRDRHTVPILRDAAPTAQHSERGLRVANALAFVACLVLNGLGASGKLTGHTVGDISDEHPTLITPAGFTFSIWSIIYSLHLGFVVWQLASDAAIPLVRKLGRSYVFLCLFNGAWIAAFTQDTKEGIEVSMGLMAALLIALLVAYTRARCYLRTSRGWGAFLIVDVAFSIYCAWVTVATALNVSITLEINGIDALFGLSVKDTQTALLLIPIIICLAVVVTHRDVTWPLTVAWAAHGIAANPANEPLGRTPTYLSYAAVATATLALLVRICLAHRAGPYPRGGTYLPGPGGQ